MWPQILEEVKNRRRFTWILLSQNAQVVGFDGTTLQLGFANPGARDSFVSGGSEDVLKQALGEALGVQWRIEAIVDPGGGGGSGGALPSGPGAPPSPGWGFGGGPGPVPGGAGGGMPRPPSAPQPHGRTQPPSALASVSSAPASGPGGFPDPRGAVSPVASTGRSQTASASVAEAPGMEPAIEDDIPEDDDQDLDDAALSGIDLIVRDMGATVIEEIADE
jgi:DNA polymerase-3 subunit gamma/tau